MSVVVTEHIDIPAPATRVRALIARPKSATGRLPAIVAWSDIFQLTPPHARMIQRIAGYGFVVIAPEIYSRIEPLPGAVFDFERDRTRALDNAGKMQVAWIDEERRAILDWARGRADVDAERLGACGWCFGGHLAFRAALEVDVKATACFYATGVHNGNLGAAQGNAGTLERANEIRGSLLLVWGRSDPHIPHEGRIKIHRKLDEARVRFEARHYEAEHAFMRDEGPRWDPDASDRAFAEMIALFRRL
jgi:carboxymethylenebutenolidase